MDRYSQWGFQIKRSDGVVYSSSLAFVEFAYDGEVGWYSIGMDEAGRPDIIAYKVYSDASLWPFLCWYNNIKDPLTGFSHVAYQMDEQGNLSVDGEGNPLLVPNVIMIPKDKRQLLSSIIPRTYQQAV